jgi:hypothetical protein
VFADRPAIFAGCAGAGLAFGLFGAAAAVSKGLPERLPPQAAAYAAAAEDHNSYRDHCFGLTAADLEAGRFCRIGVDGRPTLMVWGDSHADALMSAFDAEAKAHGVAGIDATHGSCPPMLGVEVHEHEDNGCPPLADAAIALIERYDIKTVIIAGRWAGYAEGRLYYEPSPPVQLRRAGQPIAEAGPADDHALFAEGLESTLARLRGEGRRVWIVLPVPEAHRLVPETLAREMLLKRTTVIAATRAEYDRRQDFTRHTIDRLARKYGVGEIDPASLLCPSGLCRIVEDGHPLYYDFDHLSVHGAQYVRPLIAPVFAGMEAAGPVVAASGSPHPVLRR